MGLPSFWALNCERAAGWRSYRFGNDKEDALSAIEKFGQFRIDGAPGIMPALDALSRAFVAHKRMKISGNDRACYEVVA